VNVFILYVSSMFFDPNLEGVTNFMDVAFFVGAFYFVNSFAFVRVRFIFCLMVSCSLKEFLISFLLRNFAILSVIP